MHKTHYFSFLFIFLGLIDDIDPTPYRYWSTLGESTIMFLLLNGVLLLGEFSPLMVPKSSNSFSFLDGSLVFSFGFDLSIFLDVYNDGNPNSFFSWSSNVYLYSIFIKSSKADAGGFSILSSHRTMLLTYFYFVFSVSSRSSSIKVITAALSFWIIATT